MSINWDQYLQDNPDVAASGMDAATHYALYGQNEGRQVAEIAPQPQQAAPQQVTDQQIQDWYAQHQNDQNIAEAVSQGMQTYGLDQNRVQQLTGYSFQPPQDIASIIAAPQQVSDTQITDWWAQHQNDTNLAGEVQQGMGTYGLSAERIKQLTGYDAVGQGPKATIGTPTPNPNAPLPPTWNDIYKDWIPQYRAQYGADLDRPWNADADAAAQKQQLDERYIQSIKDYNQTNGTNIQPDANALGANAQPNSYTPQSHGGGGFFDKLSAALGTDGGGSGLLNDISKTLGTAGDGHTFLGIRDEDALKAVAVIGAAYGYMNPELFAADVAAGTVAVTEADAVALSSAGVPAATTVAGEEVAALTASQVAAAAPQTLLSTIANIPTTIATNLGIDAVANPVLAKMVGTGAVQTLTELAKGKDLINAATGGIKAGLTAGALSELTTSGIKAINDSGMLAGTGIKAADVVNTTISALTGNKAGVVSNLVGMGIDGVSKLADLPKANLPDFLSKSNVSGVINLSSGLKSGNISQVLSGANSLIDSPDLNVAAKATQMVNAANSGNWNQIVAAAGGLDKAMGGSGKPTVNVPGAKTTPAQDVAPLPLNQVEALKSAGLQDGSTPVDSSYINDVVSGNTGEDHSNNMGAVLLSLGYQEDPDLPGVFQTNSGYLVDSQGQYVDGDGKPLDANTRAVQGLPDTFDPTNDIPTSTDPNRTLKPVTVTGKQPPELQLDPVTVTGKKLQEIELNPVTVTGTRAQEIQLDPVTVVGSSAPIDWGFQDIPPVDIPPIDLGTGPTTGTAPKVAIPKGTTPAAPATPTPTPTTPQYTGGNGSTTAALPYAVAKLGPRIIFGDHVFNTNDLIQQAMDDGLVTTPHDLLKLVASLDSVNEAPAPEQQKAEATNPVYAAQGGSIDDLIEYLRS